MPLDYAVCTVFSSLDPDIRTYGALVFSVLDFLVVGISLEVMSFVLWVEDEDQDREISEWILYLEYYPDFWRIACALFVCYFSFGF